MIDFMIKKNGKLINSMAKIDKYWYAEKHDKAKKIFGKALKKNSFMSMLPNSRWYAKFVSKDKFDKGYNWAIKKLSKVSLPDTKVEGLYAYFKAELLLAKGMDDEALKYYDKSLLYSGSFLGSLGRKAQIFYNIGEIEKCIAALDRALYLFPNNFDLLIHKSLILTDKKEFNKALECFDRVIKQGNNNYCEDSNTIAFAPISSEIAKTDSAAYYNKGQIYSHIGEYKKARECFEKAVCINPENAYSQCSMGVALSRQCKYKEALQYFDKAIKLDKKNSFAYWFKASALRKTKQYTQAIKAYNAYLKLEPNKFPYENDNFNAEYKIAKCYYKLGEHEEAVEYCNKAIFKEPTFLDAIELKQMSLEKLNRKLEALHCKKEYNFVYDALEQDWWINGDGRA